MFLFTNRVASPAQPPAAESVPHAQPLRQASQATGVSFDYLAKTAERESRFNPAARAQTSSATGMFQFLEQTWLGMVRQEGARFGLTNEAAAISGDNGRLSVSDPAMRNRILALREDPGVSAMMAGAFAQRNGRQLEEAIGRKPNEGELYIAHFLGASGARDLINLARTNPEAKAASSFRDAASANRSVFFDRAGRARSAAEVYGNLTASFAQTAAQPVADTAASTDKAFQMFRVKGEGKPLHGLFRSSGEPVASAVADAWGRMARKPTERPAETRVAFFPTARAGQVNVANDAALPALSATMAPREVRMPLPEARPASLSPQRAEAVQSEAYRSRKARPAGMPLDLMRFVKAGRNS